MALRDDPLRDLDEQVKDLIYGSLPGRRFTQDSRVMPDVWLKYAEQDRVDVLLTPHTGTSSGELAREINVRTRGARVAHSDTYVVAELTFKELVGAMIHLTNHDGQGGLAARLDAFVAKHEAAGASFRVVFRTEQEPIRIELGDPLGF
jgi:hypothetical protein